MVVIVEFKRLAKSGDIHGEIDMLPRLQTTVHSCLWLTQKILPEL